MRLIDRPLIGRGPCRHDKKLDSKRRVRMRPEEAGRLPSKRQGPFADQGAYGARQGHHGIRPIRRPELVLAAQPWFPFRQRCRREVLRLVHGDIVPIRRTQREIAPKRRVPFVNICGAHFDETNEDSFFPPRRTQGQIAAKRGIPLINRDPHSRREREDRREPIGRRRRILPMHRRMPSRRRNPHRRRQRQSRIGAIGWSELVLPAEAWMPLLNTNSGKVLRLVHRRIVAVGGPEWEITALRRQPLGEGLFRYRDCWDRGGIGGVMNQGGHPSPSQGAEQLRSGMLQRQAFFKGDTRLTRALATGDLAAEAAPATHRP